MTGTRVGVGQEGGVGRGQGAGREVGAGGGTPGHVPGAGGQLLPPTVLPNTTNSCQISLEKEVPVWFKKEKE